LGIFDPKSGANSREGAIGEHFGVKKIEKMVFFSMKEKPSWR